MRVAHSKTAVLKIHLIAVMRIMQIFAQKGGRRKRAAFELNNYFELSN